MEGDNRTKIMMIAGFGCLAGGVIAWILGVLLLVVTFIFGYVVTAILPGIVGMISIILFIVSYYLLSRLPESKIRLAMWAPLILGVGDGLCFSCCFLWWLLQFIFCLLSCAVACFSACAAIIAGIYFGIQSLIPK